jgi:hypothetical protein
MTRSTILALAFIAVPFSFSVSFFLSGCQKKAGNANAPAPAAAPDPQFDKQWGSLAEKGVDTFYIEATQGEGMMGNVLRVQGGALGVAAGLRPETARPLPPTPNPEEVQKVIRQNLASLKSCYSRMARDGNARSGKAIVSFEIGADGHAQALKVEAPAFQGTSLPGCVGGQIARLEFPKSQQGGLNVSYPFVFVGG